MKKLSVVVPTVLVLLTEWLPRGTAQNETAAYYRGKRQGPPDRGGFGEFGGGGQRPGGFGGVPSGGFDNPFEGGPGGHSGRSHRGPSSSPEEQGFVPGGQGHPHGGSRHPPRGSGHPSDELGPPPRGLGHPSDGLGPPPRGSGHPFDGRGPPPGGPGHPPGGPGGPPRGIVDSSAAFNFDFNDERERRPPPGGGGRPPPGGPGRGPPPGGRPLAGGSGLSDGIPEPQDSRAKQQQCRGDTFTCDSGECFPRSVKCDNVRHCRDSSDERDCGRAKISTAMRIPEGNIEKSIADGCVLPRQPIGGSYTLGGCDSFCRLSPGDTIPKNSVLNYTCNSGYGLKGNAVTFCLNGEWYAPPTCLKLCSPLKSTSVDITCKSQGSAVFCDEELPPGTVATLSCKHSYKIPLTEDPGYRELKCLEDGSWDHSLFRCLPECGTVVSHGNTLIVKGFTAKVGVFPWHVGVYQRNANYAFEQICSGTLINSNLVVSAAHCFYDEILLGSRDPTNYAIAAGKHYRTWSTHEEYMQKSFVEKILLPDRYLGARGNFAQDMALVKLRSPFTLTALVRPVCLDWQNSFEREQLQVGQRGKVAGWGKTLAGVPSEELQEINLPFIPFDECLSAVPTDFRGYITSDKFCAGYLNGSSLCDGDSGGGLCFEKEGLWYLRGVVSVSPVKENNCDYHSYTGFTYISHFLDSIRASYLME